MYTEQITTRQVISPIIESPSCHRFHSRILSPYNLCKTWAAFDAKRLRNTRNALLRCHSLSLIVQSPFHIIVWTSHKFTSVHQADMPREI